MSNNQNKTIHEGNLIVTEARQDYIQRVTGFLIIRTDAHLPVLESVGGDLIIRADAQLPALTEVKRKARISRGKTLNAPNARIIGGEFHGIAADDEYELFRSADGMYVAGCRGPWTAEKALAHWKNPRSDNRERAALFVDAIQSAEAAS